MCEGPSLPRNGCEVANVERHPMPESTHDAINLERHAVHNDARDAASEVHDVPMRLDLFLLAACTDDIVMRRIRGQRLHERVVRSVEHEPEAG